MSVTTAEIGSQPAMWQRAAELLPAVRHKLPAAGERVAVIGCGTSYFIAQAVAHLRESAGLGETDAFVRAIWTARRSRSGSTGAATGFATVALARPPVESRGRLCQLGRFA